MVFAVRQRQTMQMDGLNLVSCDESVQEQVQMRNATRARRRNERSTVSWRGKKETARKTDCKRMVEMSKDRAGNERA